ncbi:hypothetical protein BGW80DRAFT_808514 [Lactifluus volemus]|nr:hypothetical protein BGW80DRAFT_808514 [Lactifluus volemus]
MLCSCTSYHDGVPRFPSQTISILPSRLWRRLPKSVTFVLSGHTASSWLTKTLSASLCSYMRCPAWYYADYPCWHQHPYQLRAYSHDVSDRIHHPNRGCDCPRNGSTFWEIKPLFFSSTSNGTPTDLRSSVNTRGNHKDMGASDSLIQCEEASGCHILVPFPRHIKPAK